MTDIPATSHVEDLVESGFRLAEIGQLITRYSEQLVFDAEQLRLPESCGELDELALENLSTIKHQIDLYVEFLPHMAYRLRALRMA
ncbi:hypothetical protein [Rhodococcus sp. IEGM 1374]|uniref:hypothetical protein n=1 Tax=Rhodococcus sp. IEGM 1374 TaxID=3082221 RepID=UPI0029548EB6|nr:hypothetical protein [Rhodococcus sp. IEGM 1374]MDV7990495.1 hypothetical protein [Rhodococcus sp. IEGM 1374]